MKREEERNNSHVRSSNNTDEGGLGASVEVDVDDLAARLELPVPTEPTSPSGNAATITTRAAECLLSLGGNLKLSVEERQLSAIARELDEVDRLAKESTCTPSPSVALYTTGFTSKPKERPHRHSMLKETSTCSSTPTNTSKDKDKKERDMVALDDEINPVLLRHLAEDLQPGAFASDTRPPNLSFSHQHLDDSRSASQHVQSTLPPQEQLPDHNINLVEASLVVAGRISDHDDIEQANSRSDDAGFALETSTISDNNDDHRQEDLPAMIVEAKDAGFADYIKNPTFCLFFAGYLVAIMAIVALVTGVIILQEQNRQLSQELDQATAANDPARTVTVRGVQVIVNVAAQLFVPYVAEPRQEGDDPSNQPSYKAFQWLTKQYPQYQQLESYRLIQLYSLATFFYALNGDAWDQIDQGYFLYPNAHECDWLQTYSVQMCSDTMEVKDTDDDDGDDDDVGNDDTTGGDDAKEAESLSSPLLNVDNATVEPAVEKQREIRFLQITGSDDYSVKKVRGYLAPEVSFLTSLQGIEIGYTSLDTDLSNMLPTQLETMMQLISLKYVENHLRSTIPTRIARLRQLRVLHLPGNKLTGSIPSEIGNMRNLTSLHLEKNQLGHLLPSELGLLSSMLLVLDVNTNRLVGGIPTHLARLQSLTSLTLHTNGMTGTIPSELALLPELEALSLHSNPITGTLPTELGTFARIKKLNLRNMTLTGVLPSEIGLLAPILEDLFLHDNKQLVGTVPTEFGLLTNLKRLFLDGTALEGSLPEQLCKVSSLEQLVLDCVMIQCPTGCQCSCKGGG
jgi:Leucine-rich repeat (LRR) protein